MYTRVHNSTPPFPTLKNPTKTTIGQEQRGFSLLAQAAEARNSVNWAESGSIEIIAVVLWLCVVAPPRVANLVWVRVTVAWFRGS